MIGILSEMSCGARALDCSKTEVRVELIAWFGGPTVPFPDDVSPDIKALNRVTCNPLTPYGYGVIGRVYSR